MAKKKEKTPVELLNIAFQEEVNDTELRDRYNIFVQNFQKNQEEYNKLATEYNTMSVSKERLAKLIFESALQKMLHNEAIYKYQEIDKEMSELYETIKRVKKGMNTNKDLIEKYKDLSDRKLFNWWKSFKAIDPKNTLPWLEWKKPYENKII